MKTPSAKHIAPAWGFLHFYRAKLILYFGVFLGLLLILTLLIQLFGIPFSAYGGIYHQIKDESERTLSIGADLAKERIISLFNERKGDGLVLAEGSATKIETERLSRVFNGADGRAAVDLAAFTKLPDYADLEYRLRLMMTAYPAYESIKIADVASKKIMVSTSPHEVGLSVPLEALITEPITTDEPYIDLVEDVYSRYWIYFAYPIRSGNSGKTVGIAILRVYAKEAINPILKIAKGLGEGAEVVFANKELTIFAAMSSDEPESKTLVETITKAPPTTPVVWGVKGQEGIRTAVDYRGVEVVSAYRHIFISKQQEWGLVIKRRTADIYASTTLLITYFIGLYLMLAALLLWLAAGMAKNLASPIEMLAALARRVAKGEPEVRAPAFAGEPGVLAENFNMMLANIDENTHKLYNEMEEHKRAEEELTRFFNLVPDMVCVATTDGRFLKVNPIWHDVLGYTEQELLSIPFLDLIHPDDREATLKEMAKLSSGELTMHFTNRYLCKDGSYKWLEWASAPSADRSVLFAAARDITERINTLKELHHKRDQLERSNREHLSDSRLERIARARP